MSGFRPFLSNSRARHLIVAAVISLLLGAMSALAPLDWFIWASQTRTATRSASGDIVFVGATEDLTGSDQAAQGRRELAKLVTALDDSGADGIFVDIIMQRPSSPEADATLADALRRSEHAYLVSRYMTLSAGPRFVSTIGEIAGKTPEVSAREWVDPFGYTRFANLGWEEDGHFLQSLPAALARVNATGEHEFPIDYAINSDSVASYTLKEALASIEAGRGPELFASKMIVIGNGGDSPATYASIPGHSKVPASMVAILAAETIRNGLPPQIGWLATFAAFLIIFSAVVLLTQNSHSRRWGYALAIAVLPTWFVVSISSSHDRTSFDSACLPVYFRCDEVVGCTSRSRVSSR